MRNRYVYGIIKRTLTRSEETSWVHQMQEIAEAKAIPTMTEVTLVRSEIWGSG